MMPRKPRNANQLEHHFPGLPKSSVHPSPDAERIQNLLLVLQHHQFLHISIFFSSKGNESSFAKKNFEQEAVLLVTLDLVSLLSSLQ